MYRRRQGNINVMWLAIPTKFMMLKKMFFGGYRSICTAKNDFWTISMKFLPMGEGSSSAMPYHFTHYL